MHVCHLVEDEQPGLAGLRERFLHDLEGEARCLDVHLDAGDALGGARDLEVHVAQRVFDALDVGQDLVLRAVLARRPGPSRYRRPGP